MENIPFIEVNDLVGVSIERERVSEAVQLVLKEEGISEGEASVVLLPPERMRELNKEHLGRDYVTDVLSFPYAEKGIIGEIIMCPEKIEENAKGDFTKEFFRVIIHGALHLLDYDHAQPEEEKEMTRRTEHYLRSLDW